MIDTAEALAPLAKNELAILAASVYRATVRTFDAVQNIHAEMAATPATYSQRWQDLKVKSAALMAVGREQSELHTDLSDLMFDRA